MWLLNQCNLRNIELTHPSLEVTIGTHLIGKLKDWRGDLLLCKPLSWLLIFKTPSTEKRLINTQGESLAIDSKGGVSLQDHRQLEGEVRRMSQFQPLCLSLPQPPPPCSHKLFVSILFGIDMYILLYLK